MLGFICEFADHQAAISQLREAVFVEEQRVPKELELDGLDANCKHAVIFKDNNLIGTGRLTPDGHIGRVAVAAQHRNQGYGHQLMMLLEQHAEQQGFKSIALSAQITAVAFYTDLGYKVDGPAFEEAGIEHLPMSKVLNH